MRIDGDHLLGLGGRVGERFRDLLGAHVAPGGPATVVLVGEHGSDQADDRGAVGEDADDLGAPADLLSSNLGCLQGILSHR
jgi:hypothetical protein